ncbi:2-oxoacid:acceptor oxidoreductase subunit alpha [Bacillaceae bacterium IKA-2]|nr:2-oxoacid:acceptor oxidoreductase subunit alpha [Bacillaceae bacterium IKA-2]
MKQTIEWLVGGQQGEGIDSTGELFAKVLVKSGASVSTYKQFMSRIKGGHTNYKLRASAEHSYYSGEKIDILVCLDQETFDMHEHQLKKGSIAITEGEEISITETELGFIKAVFPLKSIAVKLGNSLAKNMISLGISGSLAGLEVSYFEQLMEELFEKKGEKVIETNIKAVQYGYELAEQYLSTYRMPFGEQLKKKAMKPQLFISGNEATAFGSFMAGCRYLSAYPITPASEVMEWLAEELPKVGGVVMQVEDEIAGICFAIGASYSGVRAMTSTSGPGFSLKSEAIGMAGMAEIPIVIVNSQRGGPSTGLPTKHEQSDLQQMIHGTHGEIPRIVLYPATIEDAFYLASEAFNLADRYQCPVIVALDLGMSMNKMSVPAFDVDRVSIDRGKLLTDDEASDYEETHFKRYRLTEDGISPRPKPGMKHAVHTTSSNEHDEFGYICEDVDNRIKMMKKRLEKITDAQIQVPFKHNPALESEVILVGMGSTYGAIKEAAAQLQVGHLHLQQIHPLPIKELEKIFENKTIITVENNFNAQLLQVLKQGMPIHNRSQSVVQFDGNPFTVETIITKVREMM